MLALSNLSHFVLHIMPYGEDCFLQLPSIDLCQEVRLILYGIRTRCQPFLSINDFRLGIMSSCNKVVVMSTLFMEGPKLNQTIAHHVRIRSQTSPHLIHRVFCHLVPILTMAIYHLKTTTILMCHSRSHLQVLLAAAVPFLFFLRTNLNVEAIRMEAHACKLIDHHTTIHTTREQYSNTLIFQIRHIHGCKGTNFFRDENKITVLSMPYHEYRHYLHQSEWCKCQHPPAIHADSHSTKPSHSSSSSYEVSDSRQAVANVS